MTETQIDKMSIDFICHPRPTRKGRIQSGNKYLNSKGISFRRVSGCEKRKTVKTPYPQMVEEKRPKKYRNDPCGYLKTDDGFSCQLCLFSCQKSNTMQQHCMSHFPVQHQCVECGDCFYMKGVLLNHYKVECESCGKKIRLGSISSHNCLKR